jgi:hypothetical protein
MASAYWGAARYRDPFLPLLLLGGISRSSAVLRLIQNKFNEYHFLNMKIHPK